MSFFFTALLNGFRPLIEPLMKALTWTIVAGTCLLVAFFYGQHIANEKHKLAELVDRNRDLVLIQNVEQADRTKMIEQQHTIEQLQKELSNGKAKLVEPSRSCFDTGDVDQLRKLWR